MSSFAKTPCRGTIWPCDGGGGDGNDIINACASIYIRLHFSILFATLPMFTLGIIWVPIKTPYLCVYKFMYIYFLIWFFSHFCHTPLSLSFAVFGLFLYSLVVSLISLSLHCEFNYDILYVRVLHSQPRIQTNTRFCTGHRCLSH